MRAWILWGGGTVGAVLAAPAAQAALTTKLDVAVTYDDNVFRLAPDQTVLFNNSMARSDVIFSESAQVHYESTISLQKLTLEASVNRVDYLRLSGLDYTGFGAAADWDWVAGTRFQGNIGYNYRLQASSFSDLRVPIRNLQSTHQAHAALTYTPQSRWFLYTGYEYARVGNDTSALSINNHTTHTAEGGVGLHVGATALRLGYRYNQERFAPVVLDRVGRNNSQQHDAEVRLHWDNAGPWMFDARLTHSTRSVPGNSNGNFRGLTGGGVLTYAFSPLVRLRLEGQRTLSGVDDITANFATTTEGSASLIYQPRPMLTIMAQGGHAQRINQGGNVFFRTAAPGLEERTSFGQIKAMYTWRLGSELELRVRHEQRTASFAPLAYRVTVPMVRLRVVF